VVFIEGDLETLDGAVLLELLVEISMGDIGGNVSDKDVLASELLSVGTEELPIELKASAWLSIDLKIHHLVTGVLELLVILDVDDGGPERARDILSDLWSLLEVHIGLFFKGHGNFFGVYLLLGEVIEIDEVLFLGLHFLYELRFLFFCTVR